jgi:hypothetical protein
MMPVLNIWLQSSIRFTQYSEYLLSCLQLVSGANNFNLRRLATITNKLMLIDHNK